MKERVLPERINPARLAKEAIELSGQLRLANEPRVHMLLIEDAPHQVACRVSAHRDAEGWLHLTGQMEGQVTMTCQVCLQPVPYTVARTFEWLVVASDEQAKRVLAEVEPVIMDEDGGVALHDNLLDELLLDLPIAPVHSASEHCAHRHRLSNEDDALVNEHRTQQPFKNLKDLLSK